MAYIKDYFQVIMAVPTQADKDALNMFATLMDTDPHWDDNTYTETSWNKANNGTYWYQMNPASEIGQAVVGAWVNPAKDYNAPEFAVFRDGKGIHAGVTEGQFNDFRAKVHIYVGEDGLADLGLTPDAGPLG